MDSALKQTIFDWFQFREVNDNTKFPTFFARELNKSMRKYNQLLRIEPGQSLVFPDGTTRVVTYDWMIQNYKELRERGTSTEAFSKSQSGDNTAYDDFLKNSTRNVNSTSNKLSQRDVLTGVSNESSGSGSSSTVTQNSGSNSSDDISLTKSAPQSISYPGAGAGAPGSLNWQYPSSQAENKHVGQNADNGSTEVDYDNTVSGTSNTTTSDDTEASDTTITGDVYNEGHHGSSKTVTYDKEDSTKGGATDRKIIEAGRNIDPATLLQNAVDFIMNSSAWDFLYRRLDTCFMGIYEQEVE